MEDSKKYKALSLIIKGKDCREVSDELDISYSSVLKLNNEYKDAKLQGTLAKVFDMDRLIIREAGELLDIRDSATELVSKLDGLENLQEKLQKSALAINEQVVSHIMSVEHVSELEILTDILCKLQNAFLNKSTTNVNVQNNYGDNNAASRYGQYLQDAPGSANN